MATQTEMKELKTALAKMELILNEIDEAVVWANQSGQIQWCNRQFSHLLSMSHNKLIGKNLIEVMQAKDINFLTNKKKGKGLTMESLPENWIIEDFSFNKDGIELFLRISLRKFKAAEEETSYIILIRDVTESKKLMNQLEHLAHYDLVTNLPNRLQLYAYLKREMAHVKRHHKKLGVLYVDFDGFKQINDTYSHAVGDLFLKYVAERFTNCLRQEDFIARLGGDEFVAIISDLEEASGLDEISSKVLQHLGASYNLAGHIIQTSASIGISVYPDDATDENTLLRKADEAMYQAKKRGGGTFRHC